MSRSDLPNATVSLDAVTSIEARAASSFGIGDVVGRYRIVRELGRGGMGLVFLAEDVTLGRAVALKVILGQDVGSVERRRFEREARSAAQLAHPGIATVYDVGMHGGQPFLAMEYVEGETLGQRIRRGPLTADALLELAQQLSAALGAAHDAGIIHRDLKPGNIMCSANGRVRLLDFGLARSEAAQSDLDGTADAVTRTGAIIGTPAYMAPEQARGERVSAASDVFALGVVLHEAATGRCPFGTGPTVFAVLAAVLSEVPPPLASLRSDLPPGFSDVVARCLLKDPTQRFSSASEVVRALSAGTAPGAQTPSSTNAAASEHSSRSGGQGASGASAVTGSATGATSVAVATGRVAVLPWRNTSRDPSHDWLGVGVADTLAHELRRSRGLTVVEDARVGAVVGAILARGGALEPFDVAHALGAEWVVTGSYQVAGGRVRLVGMVGNAAQGATTPCERIDGHIDDIFDLQDKLVDSVRALVGTGRAMSSSTEVRLAPGSAEAYELYARGMMMLREITAEASAQAERCFAEAIARDPGYALAHAALGQVQMMRSLATGSPPLVVATEPLERAVALNPGLAEARLWLSHTRMLLAEYEQCVEQGRVAAALNPTHAFTAMNLGIGYAARAVGDRRGPGEYVEALQALRRAVELEPASGASLSNLGLWSLAAGDLPQSRAAFERALILENRPPSAEMVQARWIGARIFLGLIELYEGRSAAAERELVRGLEALHNDQHIFTRAMEAFGTLARAECALRAGRLDDAEQRFEGAAALFASAPRTPGMWHNGLRALAGRARARGLAGNAAAARAALDEALAMWAQHEPRRINGYAALGCWSAYDLASATAALGDHDGALAALDEAHRHAWCASVMLDGDPCFAALRDDPRLAAVRARADAATAAVGAMPART